MALLKAFVCQVVLLGLYKLFLEQVVEDYLVPDEMTRNCLVGFVCLLCFGIQLYTDKAGDEDNAEADESPIAKSESREEKSAKNSESAEISATHGTCGSSTSSRVTATKPLTTSREIATEKKMSPNNKQIGDSRERSSAVPSPDAVEVTEDVESGIFPQFSQNMSDTIPNVINADYMEEPEVSASTAQTSYDQENTAIPVLNGFSESNVCEESDEDGIEIDQFVAKRSTKEAEYLRTVKDETEPIKAEYVTKNAKQLGAIEAEMIKSEDVTEAVMESECLKVHGEDISTTQDSGRNAILEIDQASEVHKTNGIAEESLNNIDNKPSDISEENESKITIKNESEIENSQEMILSSKQDEHTKDGAESLQFTQEVSNTSSNTTKEVNEVATMNKNGAETSTLGKTAISLPLENLSTVRQKAADVCIPPVTIDISFIYACH